MASNKKIKFDKERIVRNILIILTLVSIIITFLNYTYIAYQDMNINKINTFLIRYINGWLLWVDNILLYVFAIIYIFFGIKSKKEVLLKVSFSIFSILTTVIVSTLIINLIASLFGMF